MRYFNRSVLVVICLSLQVCLLAQAGNSESEPEPITIRRKGGPATIPEVPRNDLICFALYTVQNHTLKLSAQLYPLQEGENRSVTLQIQPGDKWQEIATSQVNPDGWLATFRVEKWDSTREYAYRVVHAGGSRYPGTIRRDPVDQDEIVVAAFTGNSNTDRGPRSDIIQNIQAQDPDLLFFSGDQSYDHREHTAAWLQFGRQFGEIIRNRPTITIPDDHDVGQANLWGAGGERSQRGSGNDGGYFMPADYVNRVQRAQTAHLPDPYDPTPVKQGITVYYTSLNVGGIDFAILEDRKWKSGPDGLIPQQGPRPDHINDPHYDRAAVDVPEARLLGARQLEFLRQWGQRWQGVEMKAALSQTIFAGGAHIHGKHDARLLADLDSNGWPQSGRNRALRELRRAFTFHIAGDQHLATVIHHGINSWEDSIYSFCVPSIINYYGRWWWPLEAEEGQPVTNQPEANQPETGLLPFAGRYLDGFGNKISMRAYANPSQHNHNAAGYGLIRFNKPMRTITMECWPRYVDVTQPDAHQFPGWPITIGQQDNYARLPLATLPMLEFPADQSRVIQVVDESTDEVVYTLRVLGPSWQPPVFHTGNYTIRVGEGSDWTKTFTGVKAQKGKANPETLPALQ
jgi:hypothetical protein